MIFILSFVFLINIIMNIMVIKKKNNIIILINKRKGEPDFLSDNINEEMPIQSQII